MSPSPSFSLFLLTLTLCVCPNLNSQLSDQGNGINYQHCSLNYSQEGNYSHNNCKSQGKFKNSHKNSTISISETLIFHEPLSSVQKNSGHWNCCNTINISEALIFYEQLSSVQKILGQGNYFKRFSISEALINALDIY